VPANPGGSLQRVARHHAVDQFCQDGRHMDWPTDDEATSALLTGTCEATLPLTTPGPAGRFAGELDDDKLALLPFHGARLKGRLDDAGDIIPLPGQPRDRWDAGMVRMGFVHLQAAQRADVLSRRHLLAGIAAEHAMAADFASTDRAAITSYCELLLRLDPSAAPRRAAPRPCHAIALAEAGDAARACARLELMLADTPAALPALPALPAHRLAALARAEERLGRTAAARERLGQAILQARHPADARMLARHRAGLEAVPCPGDC